jgi:hypothetical protein
MAEMITFLVVKSQTWRESIQLNLPFSHKYLSTRLQLTLILLAWYSRNCYISIKFDEFLCRVMIPPKSFSIFDQPTAFWERDRKLFDSPLKIILRHLIWFFIDKIFHFLKPKSELVLKQKLNEMGGTLTKLEFVLFDCNIENANLVGNIILRWQLKVHCSTWLWILHQVLHKYKKK